MNGSHDRIPDRDPAASSGVAWLLWPTFVVLIAVCFVVVFRVTGWLTRADGHARPRKRDDTWNDGNGGVELTITAPSIRLVGLLSSDVPLLSQKDWMALSAHLPSRCRGLDHRLLYSTDRDGSFIGTLLSRTKGRGPTFIVVLATDGSVFGGFASRDWSGCSLSGGNLHASPAKSRVLDRLSSSTLQHLGGCYNAAGNYGLPGVSAPSYFGSGESFVFRARPSFNVYRWTRHNDHFLLVSQDCLAFGGGGHFGLWLNESLDCGSTGPCDTYGNPALIGDSPEVAQGDGGTSGRSRSFKVVKVEAWGFTYGGSSTARPAGMPP